MSKVLAHYTANTLDSNGTHINGQYTYTDISGNSNTVNTSTIAIGVTALATNATICAAVATDCNTQFGTSYIAGDVALSGGLNTV